MAVSTITITSGASTLIPTVEPVVLTLGTVGPQGAAGVGVPAGGTTGQILSKTSGTNYATGWIDNFTTDVRQTIKNDSGSTLAKGTAVYVSGANGTNVLVKAALANADSTSATTIGLLYQQLANNGSGYVVTEGLLTGIDTSAATAGDPVWLSGTVAGGLLFGWANEPKAPTHIVYLGTVARAHASLGEILVTVRNGWELDELHNVLITSPTNGQVLTYQSSTGLWVNSSETGDISSVAVTSPITGGGTSGAVTIGIQDGTTAQKGAVQLTDSVASTSTTTAATANAVKTAYDQANLKVSSVTGTAPITSSGGTTPAIGITAATTAAAGAVQLTDSTSSTSTTTAATPNSVKTAYDLAASAAPKTTTLTAGTGLTGGGTLAANRTFTVDNTVIDYAATSSLRSLPLYSQKAAAEKLLAQAVWWIDAAHSSASGQTITNLGWGGSALNATAGSTGSADSNDPKFLDWTGTNYVYTPGLTGNYLSTPDASALDITGDLDLRCYVAMDAWVPAANSSLIGKWDANTSNRSYLLQINTGGLLQLLHSTAGTVAITTVSTAAPSFSAGSAGWVRVTLDVDNGASGYTVTFYTSTDGSNWTQLGNTVTGAGTTSIFSGAAAVEIGTNNVGTANLSSGKFYAGQILNGIGGTTVLNVDTSVITSGAATSFTALTGQTVTISRSASGRKTCVVTNPLWLFGTDDYMEVADNDYLDFAAADSFTLFTCLRRWSATTSKNILTKAVSSAQGWRLWEYNGDGKAYFTINDGTINAQDSSTAVMPSGTLLPLFGVRDTVADTLLASFTPTDTTTTNDTTTGSLANSNVMRVGTTPVVASSYADMEMHAAAIWRRPLTNAEITLLTNYFNQRVA